MISITAPLELASTGRPSDKPDMHLSGHEGVTVRTLKLEAPLAHAVPLRGTGTRYGDLVGLGTDKQLHVIPLPEAHVWIGAKGKVAKSACKLSPHAAAPSACVANRSGLLVATASADGCIAAHTWSSASSDLRTVFSSGSPLHDASSGGASAVTFDLSGRWMVSAGCLGSMFLLEAQGSALLGTATPPRLLPLSSSLIDQDAFDEDSELTEAQAHKKKVAEGLAVAAAKADMKGHDDSSSAKADHGDGSLVAARLERLRSMLLECMRRNEVADELEKVERADFVIDRGLVKELKASADARVAAVREEIRK